MIASFKGQQILTKYANITYDFGCDNLLQNSAHMKKVIKKLLEKLLNYVEKTVKKIEEESKYRKPWWLC